MQFRHLSYCLCFSMTFLLSVGSRAADPPVNIGGFVTELMQLQASKEGMQLALWLPSEFFTESVYSQGQLNRQQASEQLAFLKPYLVVGVAAGTMDAAGRMSYASEPKLRDRARIVSASGQEMLPLKDVPPQITAMLAAFKVAYAANHGTQNEYTFFLVFSGQDQDGAPVVQTHKKDKLTVILKPDQKLSEVKFVWNTPFDTVNPGKPCSKCSEKVSAKWSFCPFCGTKAPGTKD